MSTQNIITISKEDPTMRDASQLINELSDVLETITGDGGGGSFQVKDVAHPRAMFVIARNQAGQALGCGAIRPLDENIAEVKRMYAKSKVMGIGTQILSYLEENAKILGYSALWLETRVVNKQAVLFYESRGYHVIPKFGIYAGRIECVCFEKRLL
ncbi:MAG: acetyltransferase [Firmicutes bacterium]|nr:acetyltransferase [Bacillota bacterium]